MSDDLISRKDAIDALTTEYMAVGILGEQWAISQCIDAIKKLPSVQPKQKHGKWIVIMDEPNITFDECKCSECGVIEYFNKGWKKFSFCPNCGARMEGSE